MKRKLPRPFEMPWGTGQIVEEASCEGEYHQPSIQLLVYDEGEHSGRFSLRFCTYNNEGRFQRSPLMLNDNDIDGLRRALADAPRIHDLLKRLVL